MNTKQREQIERGESVFTGGVLAYLGISLLSGLVSLLTLGFAMPWMLCWQQAWLAKHTYINGRQLSFDGRGIQLFGRWLLWLLLTILTLGIYSLWLPVKVEQWRVKHTHVVGRTGPVIDQTPLTQKESGLVISSNLKK